MTNSSSSEPKPTLGLVGITINAMAPIAPSAFLWTTYQLQAPPDSAQNMWAAIALATDWFSKALICLVFAGLGGWIALVGVLVIMFAPRS